MLQYSHTSAMPAPGTRLYKQEGTLGRYQLCMVARCCNETRRYLPVSYEDFWMYWTGEHAQWYFQEQKMHVLAETFLHEARGGFPQKWQEDWTAIDKKLTENSAAIARTDVSVLSGDELRKLYDEQFALKKDMWAVSIFIDSLDAGDDQREIAKIQQQYSFTAEEMQTLLSPNIPAYVTLWEQALCAVKSGTRTAADVVAEFFWINADYSRFGEISEEEVRAVAQQAHPIVLASPAEVQKEILAEHGLTANPFEVFQILSRWRDERKRLNFTALYGLMRILAEALRRQNVPVEYLHWMLPHEAEATFSGSLSPEIIERAEKRGLGNTFVHMHGDGAYTFSDGEEAEHDFAGLKDFLPKSEASDLRGMIACKGVARGIVRIVQNPASPSGKEMQEGNILVTSMTRPEFVPLMKKAGAIVTDEGGISSHAAIVARELRKPCIIGTKFATQVLKDGDMVEVDANAGVVRVLERMV